MTPQGACVRRNATQATTRAGPLRAEVFLRNHASETNYGVFMDHRTFNKELEELRGCEFLYLHESQKIENLVQSYLDSPELHSVDRNRQLLYHLLNSEYAPLKRFTRTGLQPSGLLVRKFPRAGPGIVYAGFITIWIISIIYALSPSDSGFQAVNRWLLMIPLAGFTAYHLRGWLRLRAVTNEMRGLFDREIIPGRFDPATLSDRLRVLEQKGLRTHPNVFSLLQLQQQLLSPPADPQHSRA